MSKEYNQVILDSERSIESDEVDPETVREIIPFLEAKLQYYRELEREIGVDAR